MTSIEIAEVSGKQHAHVMEAIRNMEKAWVKLGQSNFRLTSYTDQWNRQQPCYELTKTECLYIATKFNDEARAKLVLRWEALESGNAKSIVQTRNENNHCSVRDKIAVAKFLSSYLNLNENSKLLIAKSIAEPLNLPLPDYTPSKGQLLSCSVLLQQNGIEMSAREFNRKMLEKGYMSELSRPSSKGSIKNFKSLTSKASEYGENHVSPNNPKETQPLYYVDKFNTLLNILGIA